MNQLNLLNSNMIKLASSFERSTNIEIDYRDSTKLNSIFITSKFEQESIELLISILNKNSNQRVRVFSGSPGLGKSTFALFAANLVSKNNPRIIKKLLDSSDNKNTKRLIGLFTSFQKSKQSKLLPVFLNGYMGNIEDAFIEKLQMAMADVGLAKKFSSIVKEVSKNQISIIKKWATSFPQIHTRYRNIIEGENYKLPSFEKKLREGASSARELFELVYSEITGGANSSTNAKSNLIGLYQKCITLLGEKGYAGIYVIYDEFGKYLEKGVHNPSLLNVQFLQDFAEYCDRSGKGQCHLTLITHLSVSQYASKLPLSIQKEWAKVEGRFQESSFFDRNTNHYKMISMVFEKTLADSNETLNTKWKCYINSTLQGFENGKIGLHALFSSNDSKKIIERCYPLHPVVLGLLPSLSQKVAQNERTLYTFLTRDEENSLCRFIEYSPEEKKLNLLGFSRLYEYFSPLIAKDTGIGGNYKVQLIYEESCNKIKSDNALAKEIIALVSLLSVVKDSSFAPISEKFITVSLELDHSKNDIKKEIKLLIKKKILLLNKTKNQFELIEGSSVDIDEEIKRLKKKKLASKDLVRLLKNYIQPSYIVPNKYNFEHNTTRFFRGEIISFEELAKLHQDLKPNYGREDGILYYIIPFSKDELDKSKVIIKNMKNECIAFVLPNTFIECKSDLEELNAVNALYTNKDIMNSGPLVRKELNRHRDILIESVEKIVNTLLGKTFLKAKCFYPKLEKQFPVEHFSQLNRFLGNIFELEYKNSIDFNSEYTNRHKVTGNISLARKITIGAMMKNKSKQQFGLIGNGPEVAIAKALKKITKSSLEICLKEYRNTIAKDGGASSEEIIEKFMSPPFGIRKGLLPLLISLWDQSLEGPVGHYCDGKFVTVVDSDHYDMLLKQPKICRIQYTEISKIKRNYMSKIGQTLGGQKTNQIKDLLEIVYSWRQTIPEFTKTCNDIGKTGKKLLIHIDSAQEPEKLIFNGIPEALGYQAIIDKTKRAYIEDIANTLKEVTDNIYQTYPNLIVKLNMSLVEAIQFLQRRCLGERSFKYSKGVNVAKIFQSTFGRLQDNIKNYPFSKKTSTFLGRVNSFDYSKHPQYFIETVADALTNSSPRNWDIKGKAMFDFTLGQAMNEIEIVAEYLNAKIPGESAIAFINKNTGEKDFIPLGIITSLDNNLKNKENQIKAIISQLSDNDQKNLLVNLLRSNVKREGLGQAGPITREQSL